MAIQCLEQSFSYDPILMISFKNVQTTALFRKCGALALWLATGLGSVVFAASTATGTGGGARSRTMARCPQRFCRT